MKFRSETPYVGQAVNTESADKVMCMVIDWQPIEVTSHRVPFACIIIAFVIAVYYCYYYYIFFYLFSQFKLAHKFHLIIIINFHRKYLLAAMQYGITLATTSALVLSVFCMSIRVIKDLSSMHGCYEK